MEWTRGDKIGCISLVVAGISMLAAVLVVPEFRDAVGLGGSAETEEGPQEPSAEVSVEARTRSAKEQVGSKKSPPAKTFEGKGFSARFSKCQKEGQNLAKKVSCRFFLVNKTQSDLNFEFNQVGSLAVDDQGVDHQPVDVQIGDFRLSRYREGSSDWRSGVWKSLPPGVPVLGLLEFSAFSEFNEINRLSLLRASLKVGADDSPTLVEFREVPLTGSFDDEK